MAYSCCFVICCIACVGFGDAVFVFVVVAFDCFPSPFVPPSTRGPGCRKEGIRKTGQGDRKTERARFDKKRSLLMLYKGKCCGLGFLLLPPYHLLFILSLSVSLGSVRYYTPCPLPSHLRSSLSNCLARLLFNIISSNEKEK